MYTHCACKIFFSVCKIDTHATALMCRVICFSKYGFMHGKDINSSHLGASFLLICNSSWQLSGQYFTAVCVSWVKKEKRYMQALLRMQSQVLRVKKNAVFIVAHATLIPLPWWITLCYHLLTTVLCVVVSPEPLTQAKCCGAAHFLVGFSAASL